MHITPSPSLSTTSPISQSTPTPKPTLLSFLPRANSTLLYPLKQKLLRERWPISSAHGAATVSKSPVPKEHGTEQKNVGARRKQRRNHACTHTRRIGAGEWEIYKLTARRRAHVQFPWTSTKNKPPLSSSSSSSRALDFGFLRRCPERRRS